MYIHEKGKGIDKKKRKKDTANRKKLVKIRVGNELETEMKAERGWRCDIDMQTGRNRKLGETRSIFYERKRN